MKEKIIETRQRTESQQMKEKEQMKIKWNLRSNTRKILV